MKMGNMSSYVKTTIDIADMLEELGNYDLSLKKCFEALSVCREKNFKNEEVRAHLIMAWNYYGTQQLKLAKETIQQVLADANQYKFIAEQAAADNLLGIVLTDIGKYDEALIHFKRGLAIRKKLNNRRGTLNILGHMSQTYQALGNLEEARNLLNQSILLADSLKDKISNTWNYLRLSVIYMRWKDFAKADYYLTMAERGATRNEMISSRNGKTLLTKLYDTRRKILLGKGKLTEALQFTLRYEKLKDSLDASDVSDRILSLQASFQLEERNHELELLTKNKQVQQDQIKIQKGKIQQQQLVIAAIVLGLILLGAMAYLSYVYYRKKHKLNKSLQEQNEEIQAQSEEQTETYTFLLKLNKDLAEKQEEIQAQAEELTEANQSLTMLNMELAEKSEELAAQSEELKEGNQIISSLNENLESKVVERTQSLEQAYKELDTFFYRSSHDFRRPLTTFMGLAEVAKITVKDTNALDLFDKVRETAINLDRMLIKLQSISDVAAEQFAIKGISFKALLDDACHVYHQELLDSTIYVEVKVATTKDVVTYPAFLKIVVENLLENAIRFRNPTAPQILFEVTESAGGIQLLVKDNGIGLEEIYIPRVFDMFFRGSEHSKGNGLGLYIVKKAVGKMHGQVTFESTYGQGTRVLIWLPLSLS
jgi:signal transduction histidine kinase